MKKIVDGTWKTMMSAAPTLLVKDLSILWMGLSVPHNTLNLNGAIELKRMWNKALKEVIVKYEC